VSRVHGGEFVGTLRVSSPDPAALRRGRAHQAVARLGSPIARGVVGDVNPNLAFVLFVIGMAGVVLEVLHPGLRLPGLAGLAAFVVSLILFGDLPVQATGVVLIVVAFVLFAVDVKMAAHGIAALLGTASLVLGGLYLYDPHVHAARVSRPLLIGLAIVLGVFFLIVARAAWRAQGLPVVSGTEALLGERAVVTETLHPAGQVRIKGESWAATLGDDPLATAAVGAKVVVWAAEGLTLMVEPVPKMNGKSDPN
jgi:membrane-bound serine protease (ClpP class)